MFDVVVPLKDSSVNDWSEFRFFLRSLKNVKNLGCVFVLGKRVPSWLNVDEVVFVELEDEFRCKQMNVINKLLKFCSDKRCPSGFVVVNDDFLFLKESVLSEVLFVRSSLNNLIKEKNNTGLSSSKYLSAVKASESFLMKNGRSSLDFELHFPMFFEKDKFVEVFSSVPWRSESFVWRSLYGNWFLEDFDLVELKEDFKCYSGYDFGRLLKGFFLSSSAKVEKARWFLDWRAEFFSGECVFEKSFRGDKYE